MKALRVGAFNRLGMAHVGLGLGLWGRHTALRPIGNGLPDFLCRTFYSIEKTERIDWQGRLRERVSDSKDRQVRHPSAAAIGTIEDGPRPSPPLLF